MSYLQYPTRKGPHGGGLFRIAKSLVQFRAGPESHLEQDGAHQSKGRNAQQVETAVAQSMLKRFLHVDGGKEAEKAWVKS